MTLLQVCTVFVLCTRSFETSHRKSENKREVLNKQCFIHADVCLVPTVFVHSTYRSDETSKQLFVPLRIYLYRVFCFSVVLLLVKFKVFSFKEKSWKTLFCKICYCSPSLTTARECEIINDPNPENTLCGFIQNRICKQ